MLSSTLTTIQIHLNLYGYSILMIFENIGNVFIVILFSRQRQNACSIYLISSAIMNNVYLIFNGFVQTFPFYYGEETIRIYLGNALEQMAKTTIVLASIDRFMITSNRASFRAFSMPKRAKCVIFLCIIFWLVACSHIPIMTTIINGQCSRSGAYAIIYSVYMILFVSLILPTVSGIFGYLTYRNMRQRHVHIQPVAQNTINTNDTIRQRDRDLLIIVISEVFAYVVTTTPYPLVLLEMMIDQYIIANKSVQYLQIKSFIFTIAFLLLLINNAAPFYIHLISSKSFRRDLKELIINGYLKLRKQLNMAVALRTNQTL